MICRNNCGMTCTCNSACKKLVGRVKELPDVYVTNLTDLKNWKECQLEKVGGEIIDGRLVVVTSLKKVVSYDANTGNFMETNFTVSSNPITLP